MSFVFFFKQFPLLPEKDRRLSNWTRTISPCGSGTPAVSHSFLVTHPHPGLTNHSPPRWRSVTGKLPAHNKLTQRQNTKVKQALGASGFLLSVGAGPQNYRLQKLDDKRLYRASHFNKTAQPSFFQKDFPLLQYHRLRTLTAARKQFLSKTSVISSKFPQ